MMGHMCLFEYSSQVEDVSGGQALRDRTGLILESGCLNRLRWT